MNLSPKKGEHIRWFHRAGLSLLAPVLTFVLAIMSLIMGNESGIAVGNSIRKAAFVVALVAAVGQFAASMFKHMTKKKYLLMCRQEALSKATLLAQQKSNEAKTRNILQLTYGCVPEWRPFNFRKNVLVYDIHEQLRTLLVEIRDSVLMLSDETDSDKVTVDLVYCYPDDTYSGRLPEPSPRYGDVKQENAWRLITSGDASCINYTLHDFLRSNESFFFRLDQENQAKDREAPEQIAGGPELGITFQEVQETVTAKIATNLRTEPGVKDDSTIVAQLKHGDTATRTGIGDNGWSRVVYQGQTLYALTSYLTTDLSASAQTESSQKETMAESNHTKAETQASAGQPTETIGPDAAASNEETKEWDFRNVRKKLPLKSKQT